MSEIKLLPCPFCGGEAILETDKIGNEQKLYYVSCKDDCITQYGYSSTKEYAIEKWNTRKPIERIVERLEEEKQRLKKVKNNCIALSDNEVCDIENQAYNFCKTIVKEEGEMND